MPKVHFSIAKKDAKKAKNSVKNQVKWLTSASIVDVGVQAFKSVAVHGFVLNFV